MQRLQPTEQKHGLHAQGVADRAGERRPGAALWRDERGQPLEALSVRELEVLRLLAAGRSDAAVAQELVISLATAKWHAAQIRGKLGVRSRTQAISRAQALGLL